MKKYTILLILCLAFSYVKAQTILINGTTVSVSQDVTFPFWLDSMSTVEIGTQVVSISALEFNIIPTSNGNSLVFSQTKIITSQQTVPNGKTWKLEGVLLDSTATTTTTNGGGNTTLVSGGEKAVAFSEESASIMNLGDAMLYCDSLQEDGYDNWVMPTLEEIMFVAGGGGVVPGTRTTNSLLTSSRSNNSDNDINRIKLFNGVMTSDAGGSPSYIRCVRHESVSVSSSNGPSTPSTLGSGMPTMISNESDSTMYFSQAMLYCDTLVENGFSDWVLPTIDQLSYAGSGGCVIDVRTSNYIWTRSFNPDGYSNCLTMRLNYLGSGGNNSGYSAGSNYNYIYYQWDNEIGKEKSRCVR